MKTTTTTARTKTAARTQCRRRRSCRRGLKGWQYAGRSENIITTPLLNANPTQPRDHRQFGIEAGSMSNRPSSEADGTPKKKEGGAVSMLAVAAVRTLVLHPY